MTDLLTSAEVARLVGVGPTAVKRWADSGALPCIRTAGGHRRFRRLDVDRFLAREQSLRDDWAEWIDVLLRDGDIYAVQALLFGERARRGSWHDVASALGQLLTEIGRRWEAGSISVLDEHVASAGLQRALTAVIESMPVDPAAPRCLLAAAESDDHTLGLSLVEMCLREAGWRSEWVGARTPAATIADRLSRGDIAMVAMSASSAVSDEASLRAIAEETSRACQASGVLLVMGGSGSWPDDPGHGIRLHDLGEFYHYAVSHRDAGASTSQGNH
jgi:excisionase family DNA binding protein